MNHEVLITEQQTVDLLLLEDDDVDFDSVKRQLDTSPIKFEISRVDTLQEACNRLKKNRFDIVMADLRLPDSDGIETVDSLAEHSQETILLVMTGLEDEEVEQEVLNRGAHGFFVKTEIRGKSILRTIQHSLRCDRFVRQHRTLLEHLKTQQESLEAMSRQLQEENELLRNTHELRFQPEATHFKHLSNHLSKETVALLATQAEQASRAKSEFMVTVCHELRTTLEGILSIHDHLMRSHLMDQDRVLVESSLANSMTLLRMVTEISEIARIESGRTQTQLFLCDLSAVLEEVASSAFPLLKSKQITLNWKADRSFSDTVLCDGKAIRQILILLLSNAIKFTSQGQIDIRGITLSSERKQGLVRISIMDTGIGIPPDKLDELQAAFSQGSLSKMPPPLNPSLGLSLTLQLVRMLGGEMGVESERWKGAHFWCDLPVRYPDDEAEYRIDGGSNGRLKRPHFLKRRGRNGNGQLAKPAMKDVLVAHESRALQLYMQEQLRQLGYSAYAAKDGSDVLYLLGKKQFDVLLVDCHLPAHDVFVIANRVDGISKAAGHERCPKVIAISDRLNIAEANQNVCEKIEAFLTVPMEIPILRETLQRCLEDDSN